MCWKAVCQRARILRDADPGFKNNRTRTASPSRDYDATAFKELVERYQGKVFTFVFHIVGNREYANEISVRVFAKCHSSLKRFGSESAILPFLYRVAVREAFRYIGASRIRTSEVAVPPGQRSILQSLSSLNEEKRMLLLLREVEGYSVTELGTLLRIDDNAVRDKLSQARRQLAQERQTDALANP